MSKGYSQVDDANLIDTHISNRQHTQVQISWKNIRIATNPKKGSSKVILNSVSGSVMPGQFLSILGASGAGKTTLLNFLSGRLISKNLQKGGEILINGQSKDKLKKFQSFAAYVQQDDIMFQTLSVRECLEFSAKLKLNGPHEDKMRRVDEIIDELRLNKCQNTKIGGPLVKGVSGGERKRTSIGVELITDPYLVFLDEPTTGLDSFTATSVMETLKELAGKGKTIIQTIHQPNSDMFEIFDRLMLMAKGEIIFFNEAKFAVDHFAKINYKCPELSNPADYFMSIMSYETVEQEIEADEVAPEDRNKTPQELYAQRIKVFSNHYQSSELKNNPDTVMPGLQPIKDSDIVGSDASWFYQFGLLANRNFTNIMRLPQTSYVKLVVIILTAGFCTLLFNNVQGDLAGVQNRNGALFFITMTMAFNAIQNVILIFPDERPVFLREVNNNMYSVSAYFWAKIISEFPSSLLTPVVFGSIVYFVIGLNTNEWYKFPIFLLSLFLIYNSSSGYALIIGTLFSDKQLAVTLTPVLIIPFMLFAGFFVNQDNIPKFLIVF